MVQDIRECALCGAAYTNATKHQQFHDELDAWVQLIELELDSQLRRRLEQRASGLGVR